MTTWRHRPSEHPAASSPLVWALDDSSTERALVLRVLSPLFEVRTFSEGGTLLEALMAEQPEALILDWHMPDISGVEVLQHIRQSYDEVTLPVLILTASTDSRTDVLEALDAGANDFATKPFVTEELRARVSTLLRIRRLHDRALRAEEAHQHALVELQSRADFERQLIGIVSHDLRTPLGAIAFGGDLLSTDDTLSTTQEKVVRRIVSSTKRATRLIADLLDFTAIRLGAGLPVVPGPGDLHALTKQVLGEIAMAHPGRELVHHALGIAQGSWDSERIGQVVANLVSNALHYSPADTPVEVTTSSEGERAVLTVRNAGAPIPADLLPRLFAPMERGEVDGVTARRSVGLGLFIVDGIVRAHGGTIEVRSSAAEGTTFAVRLP